MGKRRTRKRRRGYAIRLPSGEIKTPIKTWWMRQAIPETSPKNDTAPKKATSPAKATSPKKKTSSRRGSRKESAA